MVAMKSADQFKKIVPIVMQTLKPASIQQRPDVEKDYDALVPILLDEMNSRAEKMMDKLAVIYAKNFTADELNEITAFYRSPTGQKFVERLPRIMQESLTAGQEFAHQTAPELQKGHKI